MMTPQTAAMLQNNAGDPRMVSRIAQEQGLSQEEVAQALRIPVEAAARYDVPAKPMASGVGMDGPALDSGMPPVGVEYSTSAVSPMPSGVGMNTDRKPEMAPMPILIADQGMKPVAAPPPVSAPATKPMPVPKPGQPVAPQMGKPMLEKPAVSQPAGFGQPAVSAGLRQPMGGAGFRQPRGRPNLAGSQQRGVGEQAFVNAFNRMRGNVQ